MTIAKDHEGLRFVAVSQIQFPTRSRKYLMDLLEGVIKREKAQFVVVAGNLIDGKALEEEMRKRKKFILSEMTSKERKFFDGAEFEDEFIDEFASELDEFLPRIRNVNWHIIVAEKVYDRPLGVRIIKRLASLRKSSGKNDIRLIGENQDGTYDPEPKIPSRMKGFEEIRVIVPRRAPWFYRIITSFMQRLINSFVPRTFSPKPSMILVGCTGTAAYLPFYEGVPCISIPALHKLDEQRSTENVVGCSVIKVIPGKEPRVISRLENFRPAIFHERESVIPGNATKYEAAAIRALVSSSAGLETILFRIRTNNRERVAERFSKKELKEVLKALVSKKIVSYDSEANRYSINESAVCKAHIDLNSLYKGVRVVKHGVISCAHVGSLKTLYYTSLYYLPQLFKDVDAVVENGDHIVGIAHNYMHNGELLPTLADGFDKQEILAANLRAKNLLDIFKARLVGIKQLKNTPLDEIIRKYLPAYVYNIGNHPAWKYYARHAILLGEFDGRLRQLLVEGVFSAIRNSGMQDIDYETIKKSVEKKVVRVGESRLINLDNIVFGIKHPFKGRTQSKSHRIQDVVDFVWKSFEAVSNRIAKNSKGFGLAYVANFHEAAAVHVVKYGRTILGVMTGAFLRDTQFETHMDKFVDFGSAIVRVGLNEEDQLVFSEVEYNSHIHPGDARLVSQDQIKTSKVLELETFLTKRIVDLPWR